MAPGHLALEVFQAHPTKTQNTEIIYLYRPRDALGTPGRAEKGFWVEGSLD